MAVRHRDAGDEALRQGRADRGEDGPDGKGADPEVPAQVLDGVHEQLAGEVDRHG
jgi:hypothetical protein